MKLLIAGDSFATKSSTLSVSWMELLATKYNVTNIAQAGISEYKILKQLRSINLNDFDRVIVCHTSPSRIHTNNHPLHKSGLHKDCDLILNDLVGHFQPFNTSLQTAKNFFKYHYDEEYQLDIYNLIRQEIKDMIVIPYISMTHLDIASALTIEENNLDFSALWAKERGTINHYTEYGNKVIFERVLDEIKKTR